MQKLLQIRKFKIQVVFLLLPTYVPPPHFRSTGLKFESFDVRIKLSEHDLSKKGPLTSLQSEYFQNFPKGDRISKNAGVTQLLGDFMNFGTSLTCSVGQFHTDSTPNSLSSVEMSNWRIFYQKILPPPPIWELWFKINRFK